MWGVCGVCMQYVCVCVFVCVMWIVSPGCTVLGLACDCSCFLGFLTCIVPVKMLFFFLLYSAPSCGVY